MLLFTIQSRMRANNQRVYTPHEGRLVSDINRVRGPSRQPGRVLCRAAGTRGCSRGTLQPWGQLFL